MTFWKSLSFKSMQKDWYQRLKDEGFYDAERLVGDDTVLRQSSFKAHRGVDQISIEAKEKYYVMLSQMLEGAKFRNEIDELVMTWWSDGRKIKDICAELESRGEYRCRGAVRFIIRRYEMDWGIRVYTKTQLNRK